MPAVPPERIETRRTVVRRWVPADAEALHEAIVDNLDHLRPWMPWIAAEPRSVEDRRALIADWSGQWDRAEDFPYGVLSPDGAVLGGTGLHRRLGPGRLEIGYWIHSAHARRGLATEVAEALTAVALGLEQVEQVVIRHDRANVASGAIPRRLGYRLVSEERVPITSPGEAGVQWTWVLDRPATPAVTERG